MVSIKIACNCGQHYAFDVEPEQGRMTGSVACPTCGADGTTAANEQLARQLAEPTTAVKSKGLQITRSESTHSASPPATASGAKSALNAAQLGMVSREQAEVEARAKISWGDSPADVTKYLMIQGFAHAEATELVQELFRERTAITRGNGMKKIMFGIGLVLVPMVAWVVFSIIGVIPLRLMGIAIAVGIWGAWKIISGSVLILAPKMEKGDVADQ